MRNKKAGYLTGLKNSNLAGLITAIFSFLFDHSKSYFSVDKILSQFKNGRAHSDDGTNYGASFNYRHMILLVRVVVLGAAGASISSRTASYNLNTNSKARFCNQVNKKLLQIKTRPVEVA